MACSSNISVIENIMLSSDSTGIETSSRQIPLQEGLMFYISNVELSGTSLLWSFADVLSPLLTISMY